MILVLIYWVYLFFMTSSAGVLFLRTLKLETSHPSITIILGILSITMIASIWSIFFNLSLVFECFLIVSLLISTWVFKKDYILFFKDLLSKAKALPLVLKILFSLILLMAAAKCASAPYLIDNESYYIQSIKWLDSFGFVKGLGNLHLFLNQNSGWHILQSALNLDFIFSHFNDLSGFMLLVINFYAFDQLSLYFKKRKNVYLIAGFLPVFNILLFQFINAPSPDIAIYVLSFIIIIESFKKEYKLSSTPTQLIFLMSVFAVFIKVISLPIVIFPLYYLIKEKSISKAQLLKLVGVATAFWVLFLTKNAITSGYPFYPLDLFSNYNPDWKVPKVLQEYIVKSTKNYAYFLTDTELASLNVWQLFLHWLNLPKLHGLFNKVCILLLLVIPFLFKKWDHKKTLILFYLAFILQILLLAISSPQYRFFLVFIIIGFCLLLSKLVTQKKLIHSTLLITTIFVAIPLFVPIDLNKLTKNTFHLKLDEFKVAYFFIPHKKTQYKEVTYQSKNEGNLDYNSPVNLDFFWGVGDGPIPALQETQLYFFKNNYKVIPQQRSIDISDGFFSKELNINE